MNPLPVSSIILVDAATMDVGRDHCPWQRNLNPVAVDQYTTALNMGATFPPIELEKDSLRLLGGLHRRAAYIRHAASEHVLIPSLLYEFPNEQEVILFAGATNASHGMRWSSTDLVRLICLAERERIDPELFGRVLHIGQPRYRTLGARHWVDPSSGETIPLKAALSHLVSIVPSAAQMRLNQHATVPVSRMARDIIGHIKADAIDLSSSDVVAVLTELYYLIAATFPHLPQPYSPPPAPPPVGPRTPRAPKTPPSISAAPSVPIGPRPAVPS